MTQAYPSRPPRLDRLFISAPLYFVTICTYRRQPLLARREVLVCMDSFARDSYRRRGVALGRFVIMPDHVHFFVRGGTSFRLGSWVGLLKQRVTQAVTHVVPDVRKVWQEGFFDHVLRSNESYSAKWLYVRENPVRMGLVGDADAWPYSGEVVRIDRA